MGCEHVEMAKTILPVSIQVNITQHRPPPPTFARALNLWEMGIECPVFIEPEKGDLSLVAQTIKNPSVMQETQARSLGREDPLEKGLATHSYSCLEIRMDRGAWRAIVHAAVKSWTQLSN